MKCNVILFIKRDEGMKIFCLVLTLFFWGMTAHGDELPLDYFIKHNDYLDVKISPNGTYYAARLRQNEKVILVFFRRSDGQILSGVDPDGENLIHSVTWVSDDRVVYELAEKYDFEDSPISTGELFATNVDGSRSELLFGFRATDAHIGSRISNKDNVLASQSIINILPNDKKNILIAEYPWEKRGDYWYDSQQRGVNISKLNVFTGRKKKLEHLPFNIAKVFSDDDGNVNFVYYEDEDGYARVSYREDNESAWQTLSQGFAVDDNVDLVSKGRKNNSIYYMDTVTEKQYRGLYELDLTSEKSTLLTPDLTADIEAVYVDPGLNQPVVLTSYPETVEYKYTDNNNHFVKMHKKLAKAFNDQSVSITSSTQDGSLMIVRVESDTNPGEYFIVDVKTSKVEPLITNYSWIDPKQMRPKKPISVTSRDGLRIPGYITLPDLSMDEKAPLVVLIHGGPHGVRDYWEYDSEVQLLANRGYAVLQVNYRSSGGYGYAFNHLGYQQWGEKVINDIVDSTNWVIEHLPVDGNRACIYGASFGAYAALMSSVKEPDLFKCAVGFAGIYDLTLLYKRGDIRKNWGGQAYLERAIGNDFDKLKAFSPVNFVADIKADIMLIHGKEDIRAPYVHATAMRKKLKETGKPIEWLTFEYSGHGVWEEKYNRKYYQNLLRFFDKNLKAN